MKGWKKGAIVGGVWGFVSLFMLYLYGLSAMGGLGSMGYGSTPDIPLSHKILMAPLWIFFYYDIDIPVIGIFLPIFVGAFFVGGIGFLVDKWRER